MPTGKAAGRSVSRLPSRPAKTIYIDHSGHLRSRYSRSLILLLASIDAARTGRVGMNTQWAPAREAPGAGVRKVVSELCAATL